MIFELPNELIILILSFLNRQSILAFTLTCKKAQIFSSFIIKDKELAKVITLIDNMKNKHLIRVIRYINKYYYSSNDCYDVNIDGNGYYKENFNLDSCSKILNCVVGYYSAGDDYEYNFILLLNNFCYMRTIVYHNQNYSRLKYYSYKTDKIFVMVSETQSDHMYIEIEKINISKQLIDQLICDQDINVECLKDIVDICNIFRWSLLSCIRESPYKRELLIDIYYENNLHSNLIK